MTTTTVSSKYQIVIPKAVRERQQIKPGMRLYITDDARGLHLMKEPSLEEMRGLLKGMRVMDSDIRDERDRDLP